MCILAEETREQKDKRMLDKIGKMLKKSVVAREASLLPDDRLPSSEAEQLKEFNAAIYSNSRQKTYHYCLIGRNLSVLKRVRRVRNLLSMSKVIFRQSNIAVAKYIFRWICTTWLQRTIDLCM